MNDNLKKNSDYSRQEVFEIFAGKGKKIPFNIQRTGYGRVDENILAFLDLSQKGIYPNLYDKHSEKLIWHGKKKSHSEQPEMKKLINGEYAIFIFARWEENTNYTFLGKGCVLDFKNNKKIVDNEVETFCIEFTISCGDDNYNSALINNFDYFYEESIPESIPEGKQKYVEHKVRERNSKLVKDKKSEFLNKFKSLYCEVCKFDFEKVYGNRGKGFIECHHDIPLHVEIKNRLTKKEDLSLLCSNCHRMIHNKKNWLTVTELKKIFEDHK